MAGFLAYMAAGAAQGAGQGIVAEAKARREAAIAELEHGRTLAREQTDRDFRASENAKDRAATAEQGRLGRRETATDADGNMLLIDGDRATPIKGADGNAVRAAMTSKDQPADVQTAQWLIQQGAAKDVTEAWNMVRSARSGTTTMADVEAMVERRIKTDFGGGFAQPKPEEVNAAREAYRTELMDRFGMSGPQADDEEDDDDSSARGRPANLTEASAISEAKAAIAAGADPAAVRSRLSGWGIDPAQAGL